MGIFFLRLAETSEKMLTPQQVRERIVKLQDALRRGDHSTMKEDDEIGEALSELQKVLLDLLSMFCKTNKILLVFNPSFYI